MLVIDPLGVAPTGKLWKCVLQNRRSPYVKRQDQLQYDPGTIVESNRPTMELTKQELEDEVVFLGIHVYTDYDEAQYYASYYSDLLIEVEGIDLVAVGFKKAVYRAVKVLT